MKINNLTPFDTERLRAIAQHVAEAELESNQRLGVTVHFVTAKSRSPEATKARREGFYRRIVGKLPEGLKYNVAIVAIRKQRKGWQGDSDSSGTALLLAHEFAEMRGLTHEQMRTPRYFFREGWSNFYEWCKELPLILKAPKPKPSADDVVGRKLAHAVAMLAKAKTRERRASTIRHKWQTKVRYYQRKREGLT